MADKILISILAGGWAYSAGWSWDEALIVGSLAGVASWVFGLIRKEDLKEKKKSAKPDYRNLGVFYRMR